MNTPEIDLHDYHVTACQDIADHFGTDVEVVAAYPRFEHTIPAVAITIELDGITPDNPDDMGTEQLQADLRFAAHVFVSYLEQDAKLTVRRIAARLAAYLHGKRFGQPVTPARVIVGQPDMLSLPGRTGRDGDGEDYEVWRVEWSHTGFLGESVWTTEPDDQPPTEVWTSAAGDQPQTIITP